jgi:hypothetical protein
MARRQHLPSSNDFGRILVGVLARTKDLRKYPRAYMFEFLVLCRVSGGLPMYRVALICFCLLATLGASASAADYPGRYVRYSGDCCQQRAVSNERELFYAPFSAYPYVVPLHPVYVHRPEQHRVVHFKKYDYYSSVAAARCHWQEAPIHVERGLWVWGGKTNCY